MALANSNAQIASAIVRAVNDGVFPDADEVLLADLQSSTAPAVRAALLEAERALQAEVKALASTSNIDIDGWIRQARQLQLDIQGSTSEADGILELAEKEKSARSEVEDVGVKVDLLRAELEFNELLGDSLENIRQAVEAIEKSRRKLMENDYIGAVELLDKQVEKLDRLQPQSTLARRLLLDMTQTLRREILQNADKLWSGAFKVDKAQQRISVQKPDTGSVGLDVLADAFAMLDVLPKKAEAIYRAFDQTLLAPLLNAKTPSFRIQVQKDTIQLVSNSSGTVDTFFNDLTTIIQFLHDAFPPKLANAAADILLTSLSGKLTETWLPQRISTSLAEAETFQHLLEVASSFDDSVSALGWKPEHALRDWTSKAARVWLVKKRESVLHTVRELIPKRFKETEQVKKIEKRLLHHANEEDSELARALSGEREGRPAEARAQDEDVSGWGFDDDDEPAEESVQPSIENTEDDGVAEAWDWDDNEDAPSGSPKHKKAKPNGEKVAKPVEQEITLEETLTVTGIPGALMQVILNSIKDGDDLSNPSNSKLTIAPAAAGIYSLPTLVLAMYRASAQFYYSGHESGNMFVYNDCSNLVEQLNELVEGRPDAIKALEYRPAGILNVTSDIKLLETYGRRAYSQEMAAQKQILRDFLDGAQGFNKCSIQPFLGECNMAVDLCIDRIKLIHKQWSGILSSSVLLQAVGSLVSSVINKIIVDIEDKSQISEPESQKLCDFCGRFNLLDEIFTAPGSTSEDSTPQTAVFTRGWLKFQYLINILESSLADIKFLWKESELSLEFSADEVIDLIEALFEDSEHRRRAISEIKNHRGRAG